MRTVPGGNQPGTVRWPFCCEAGSRVGGRGIPASCACTETGRYQNPGPAIDAGRSVRYGSGRTFTTPVLHDCQRHTLAVLTLVNRQGGYVRTARVALASPRVRTTLCPRGCCPPVDATAAQTVPL